MSGFSYRHWPLDQDPAATATAASNGAEQDRDQLPFRILKLHKGAKNALLECNLLVRYLKPRNNRIPRYQGLSYQWGPQGGNCFVRILEAGEAYRLPIRPNLDAALRQIRSESEEVYVWVDAICINQNDRVEKSQQIPLMNYIYSKAEHVLVWLGEATNDSDMAMSYIDALDEGDFDAMVVDPSASQQWAAVLSLLRRPWFSRRWIIQEIALAKSADVLCGSASLSWQTLARVISMISEKQEKLRLLFRASSAHSHHPDYVGELSELGAVRLAEVSANVFRKTEEGQVLEHLYTLEALMSSLTAFEAGDPHDVLYAILWLARDAAPVSRPRHDRRQLTTPEHERHFMPLSTVASPVSFTFNHSQDRRETNGSSEPFPPFANPTSPLSTMSTYTHGRRQSISGASNSQGSWDGPSLTNDDVVEGAADTSQNPHIVIQAPSTSTRTSSSITEDASALGPDVPGLSPNIARPRAGTNPAAPNLAPPVQRSASNDSNGSSHSRADSISSQLSQRSRPRLSISITNIRNERAREQIAGLAFLGALQSRHVVIDYDKTVFEVCKDFLEFVVHRRHSLDMICLPWAPNDETLPSWIPQLRGSAFAPTPGGKQHRVNADPLVGRPAVPYQRQPYNACKSDLGQWKLKDGDDRCLIVEGFILDVVATKTDPASNGSIPVGWLKAGGWTDTNVDPPEAFWRTIIGNLGKDERTPPPHWRKRCQEAFASRPAGYDIDTSHISDDCKEGVRDFIKRVTTTVWSRRLVTFAKLSQDNRSLGLAPKGTKTGDLVCVLRGCSVPVILRKMEDGQPAKKRRRCDHEGCPSRVTQSSAMPVVQYHLVGECYVHGMMLGEAYDYRQRHRLQMTDFELI